MNKYIYARKGIHLVAFVLPLCYYYYFSQSQFVMVSGCLAIIACSIELLRFRNTKISSLFYKLLAKMLWQHESKTITGATTFVIATFTCAILFSKPVVVTALLFLTFGDTISYFIRGKIKICKGKTLESGVAFLVISVIIVLLIPEMKPLSGFVGAFVACLVELLPWKIDDNLSIPLISCPIMQLLF